MSWLCVETTTDEDHRLIRFVISLCKQSTVYHESISRRITRLLFFKPHISLSFCSAYFLCGESHLWRKVNSLHGCRSMGSLWLGLGLGYSAGYIPSQMETFISDSVSLCKRRTVLQWQGGIRCSLQTSSSLFFSCICIEIKYLILARTSAALIGRTLLTSTDGMCPCCLCIPKNFVEGKVHNKKTCLHFEENLTTEQIFLIFLFTVL